MSNASGQCGRLARLNGLLIAGETPALPNHAGETPALPNHAGETPALPVNQRLTEH